MGSVRHVADIRADDMDQDGQGVIGLQSGKSVEPHCLKLDTRYILPCKMMSGMQSELFDQIISGLAA